MTFDPPAGSSRMVPLLYYRDVGEARDWLTAAFGFREVGGRTVHDGAGVLHAEVEYGGVVVALQRWPDGVPPTAGGAPGLLFFYTTEDVDGHFARATASGGKVIQDLEDAFYGDRRYGVEDPEGHQWVFAQHVRDVAFDGTGA